MSGRAIAASPQSLSVQGFQPTVGLGAAGTVTATGATKYDIDVDGDGIYDTVNTAAARSHTDTVETHRPPGVRGHAIRPRPYAGRRQHCHHGQHAANASVDATPIGPTPLVVLFTGTVVTRKTRPAHCGTTGTSSATIAGRRGP